MGARKTRRKLLLGFVSLIMLLGLPSFVAAEDPVNFVDSNLKAAVENALSIPNPTSHN